MVSEAFQGILRGVRDVPWGFQELQLVSEALQRFYRNFHGFSGEFQARDGVIPKVFGSF